MRKLSKVQIVGGITIATIGLLTLALLLWAPWRVDTTDSATGPSFQAVTPKNTAIETLGGWQQLTPPDGSTLYVYTDSIEDVSISVSQQPLPDSFRQNTATKVAELAKSYNATTTLDAGGVEVFIGTSGDGPQSVIFTKNSLLVLIKSRDLIQNESWIDYVTSLE